MGGTIKSCALGCTLLYVILWCCLVLFGHAACPFSNGSSCDRPCQVEMCEALKVFWVETHWLNKDHPWVKFPAWQNSMGWKELDTRPCADLVGPGDSRAIYCSWLGVECCDANKVQAGSCRVENTIHRLKIESNRLGGRVNNTNFTEPLYHLQLCGLTYLSLQGNTIDGTLTDAWGKLTDLEVLQLGNNCLEGPLPDGLQYLAKLRVLDLGINFLNGSLPFWISNLTALEKLILNANIGEKSGITGTIPADIYKLSNLEELSLQANNLTGTLPESLCGPDSKLASFSIHSNLLTGEAKAVEACKKLITLDISENSLSGTLPAGHWPQLRMYRAGGNRFSGSIPSQIYQLEYLLELDVGDNCLTGSLPDEVITMRSLVNLIADRNRLSGNIPDYLFYLPDLERVVLTGNTDIHGRIPDNINYAFSLNTIELSNTSISGEIPTNMGMLGLQKVDFSMTGLTCRNASSKDLCITSRCLPCFLAFAPGTRVVPSASIANGSMTCQQVVWNKNPSNCCAAKRPHREPMLVLDPLSYGYETCQCLKGWRAKWVGPHMTCVANRRETYLSQSNVIVLAVLISLAGVAMLVAGLLVGSKRARVRYAYRLPRRLELEKRRKAGAPTQGLACVVVTDIEGYSAMMKASPQWMAQALTKHNQVIQRALTENAGTVLEQEGDSYSVAFHDPFDAICFCLQVQQALMKVDWPNELAGFEPVNDAPHASLTKNSSKGGRGIRRSLDSLAYWGRPKSERSLGQEEKDEVVTNTSSASDRKERKRLFSLFLRPSKEEGLFYGLRVRMGVATGTLDEKQNLKNSHLLDLAKTISDMGNGGQILMGFNTFDKLKDRILELGAVHHNGMDYKLLAAYDKQAFLRKLGFRRHQDQHTLEPAVVLDMGEYAIPGFSAREDSVDRSVHGRPVADGSLHVWQILSPSLVGRAHKWKNKLALKEGTRCLDQPFFNAPGAHLCPLGSHFPASLKLPPITMVFSMVEGAKKLLRRHRQEATSVHQILVHVIKKTLVAARDGYLCREQPGELKYMVAFRHPHKALEWSLVVQEALMYEQWPPSILGMCECAEQELAGGGGWTFRGPRLKIGVCEGAPRTILPDHLGRADYHGASINQSARYMDAAAHGGQVVCDLELAQHVFRMWRGELDLVADGGSRGAGNLLGAQRPLKVTAALPHQASDLCEPNRDTSETSPCLSFTQPCETERPTKLPLHEEPSGGSATTTTSCSEDKPSSVSDSHLSVGRNISYCSDSFASTFSALQAMPPKVKDSPQELSKELDASPVPTPPCQVAEDTLGGSAEPKELKPHQVSIYEIGLYQFKGNPDPVHMVQMVLDVLQERKFPEEAAKGKGVKIGNATALVDQVPSVLLPTLDPDHKLQVYRSQPGKTHPQGKMSSSLGWSHLEGVWEREKAEAGEGGALHRLASMVNTASHSVRQRHPPRRNVSTGSLKVQSRRQSDIGASQGLGLWARGSSATQSDLPVFTRVVPSTLTTSSTPSTPFTLPVNGS